LFIDLYSLRWFQNALLRLLSVIYGKAFAKQLEGNFLNDMKECSELSYENWIKQSIFSKLTYAVARLVSSFL
jgi:cardiolipin synthase